MSSEADQYTQQLLDRTRARNEALQLKMQEHSFQARKRRPLETQENLDPSVPIRPSLKPDDNLENSENPIVGSPNKRSRMDTAGVSTTEESKTNVSKGEKSVAERMKKLLNQRKQWEAADHDEEIDFSDLTSPVRNDQKSPAPGAAPNRKIDVERKARLAAFAKEINSREDDLSHPTIPRSPEKSNVQHKPPTTAGRTTPMSKSYRAQIMSSAGESAKKSKTDDGCRPMKNVSQRVSLSIETLSQFANKEIKPCADNPKNTPIKSIVQKKLSAERITVGSCQKDTDEVVGHQVTPTTKSLHERLIELQKNGCKAQHSSGMDKVLAERQEELDRLRGDYSSGNEVSEDVDEVDKSLNEDRMAVTSSFTTDKDDVSDFEHDNSLTSLKNTDVSVADTEEEESGLSFGDSMMDSYNETRFSDRGSMVNSATQCDLSTCSMQEQDTVSMIEEELNVLSAVNIESVVSEEEIMQEDESNLEEDAVPLEEDSEDQQMIDDLFDGVENEEDEDNDEEEKEELQPPPYTDMALVSAPSLTRQKSRQEIRSELIVCKQTCHEAEDRHVINRNQSRRLRPLARSNSTESLNNEQPPTEPAVAMFTIDDYRTEKRKSLRKVEKKIVRKEEVKQMQNGDNKSRIASLKEKNSKLLEEVQQQQRVIQQASAALNCCYDVHHGKGSITELEAEKLLLIASEKRLALLTEIQKLKAPDSGRKPARLPCRGTLTVDHIQLPLRTEYIFSMASKKDGGDTQSHYYFILVRCGAHKIFATHLASTHDSLSADSLMFKDKFQFDDLESDFEVVIEVYSVNHRTRADGVPNQEKSKRKMSTLIQKSQSYQMSENVDLEQKFEDALHKTKAKAKQVGSAASSDLSCSNNATLQESLTPRKLKSRSHHGSISHQASPGGPNAIRISSFSLIGSVTLRLSDVKKNKFVLQKVPFMSPISGHLACRINTDFQSNVEQRGFLTMFDDVGGLGAWHRRWCALVRGVLYSWTYPDDEKHKEALSKLEIRECTSRDIQTVERIMCARPNTFQLRTMRPRRKGDKANLISQDTGSVVTTKHWLAADTKEERLAWIEALNQALTDVRAWDPAALKPL